MLRALLGKKIGMSQLYEEGGNVVPVTVIQAGTALPARCHCQPTSGDSA